MSRDVDVSISCPRCRASWGRQVDSHDSGLYSVCTRCREILIGHEDCRCGGPIEPWDERTCPRCRCRRVRLSEYLCHPS